MSTIAKVVVELSLDREFDYIIPGPLKNDLHIGSQVVVPFGHRETRGYIVGFSDISKTPNLKEIKSRVGTKPLINQDLMKLAYWLADYYASPIEQAIKTVLPSVIRKKEGRYKQQLFVIPTSLASDTTRLEALQKKAPKQATTLSILRDQGPMFAQQVLQLSRGTFSVLRGLEDKGFVKIGHETMMRDPFMGQTVLPTQPLELMLEQRQALDQIKPFIDSQKSRVMLLHGVTGSGKTEVYLQAINYVLDQKKGSIVLVPEISLTPQMVERFRGRFGDKLAVLHSHLSSGERHDEWRKLYEGKSHIAIGARSAVFAPVKNLGLIVVDEEHETSYKQDKTPRYHARDVAVMRGSMEGCTVILGSATPSLESYQNVFSGKYQLARLDHRVDDHAMPSIRIIDMRHELGQKGCVEVFSKDLTEAIQIRLDRAEQTILFLNRRGFATSLICSKCGYVEKCNQCSVSMTYHKQVNELRCHICGKVSRVPNQCPEPTCKDPAFRMAGVGTQKVEVVLRRLFPHAAVQRMDADTTTGKYAYDQIFGDFRSGKIDILIGTQMIAKGLHFPNVTLVGVIFADTTLHMPDFRAGERTFQLLTQVAGRAGRGDIVGEVIVQTYTPSHPAIQAVRRMDFEGFMDQELGFRRELFYPPFAHLILVTVEGVSEEKTSFSAEMFTKAIVPKLQNSSVVTGPSPAPIAKAKGFYRFQILVRTKTTRKVSEIIKENLLTFTWPPKIKCTVDIDALSLL
ncbi:MAG: primosomal protein N' [Kiritimatiellae bacterium]|nr:primosomal protein N' [Kiritimatiellia bacterium]